MKFPVWASVFTLLGAAILLKLGFWQLERMAWKRDLLARLDTVYASHELGPLIMDGRSVLNIEEFSRGYVEGEYLSVPSILVGPRLVEKKPGFHLYAALRVGGAVVFVNRGWVPLEAKERSQKDRVTAMGTYRVSGLFRVPESPAMFVAGNDPARGIWRQPDPAAFSRDLNLGDAVSPMVLYAEKEESLSEDYSGRLEGAYNPVRVNQRPQFSNNHFQYALFWFSMCGLLTLFYGLRFHNTIIGKS
ncbi:MAG: SURF1 family protein [Alphaproteobacteria bacterium]|nr:SURF1 family protein [Alphaproteobacteria bacterium]MCB9975275.1 SURF1 family protein [Rhodospirillales bacterium]